MSDKLDDGQIYQTMKDFASRIYILDYRPKLRPIKP